MSPYSPAPADLVAHRQRRARILLSLALVLLGLWIVQGFLASLIWAAVIAIAISPLYGRVKRRWPKAASGALAPLIATTLIAAIVLVPITVGLFRAAAEAQDAVRWLASARDNGVPVPSWLFSLPVGSQSAVAWWQVHLATPEATRAELARFDNAYLIHHTQLVGKGLIHRSVVFAFTLLALFFVLRDGEALVAQMRRAGTALFGPSAERIGQQVVQSVRGTIDGLVLVGIGEGALMVFAYMALGVPHPILMGAITAVAAMIPFGAALVFAVAAFMLLVQNAVTSAILVMVIGLAVVGVADHFVRPVLIGGATRLPFLWVLIGILGGVETLGLLGLFVGPATMAVLVMLWRELIGHDLPDATRDPVTEPL
ncbi:AI-2E family transporter [Sphingomonas morindae]|uniref:AI-2E family transporter n=1 Tax=Sphingomonas morindae TaxID=1541170 RepID=A0ABY4X7R8_9SPHN|nr:AI-2E family transporter [Sphingomonas morindae]USI72941.1 AI-2E family transporter [Sphingomonas morindae]